MYSRLGHDYWQLLGARFLDLHCFGLLLMTTSRRTRVRTQVSEGMRRTNARQRGEVKATYRHILDVATGSSRPAPLPRSALVFPSPSSSSSASSASMSSSSSSSSASSASMSSSSSSSSASSASMSSLSHWQHLCSRPPPLHDYDAQMAALWPGTSHAPPNTASDSYGGDSLGSDLMGSDALLSVGYSEPLPPDPPAALEGDETCAWLHASANAQVVQHKLCAREVIIVQRARFSGRGRVIARRGVVTGTHAARAMRRKSGTEACWSKILPHVCF